MKQKAESLNAQPTFIEPDGRPSPMDAEPMALADRVEVADTVTRLFVNTDEGNWTGVADCFAPKVLFDMSSLSGSKPSKVPPRR